MTTSASVCRSCSAPITWGESANGKRTPLDPDGTSHFRSCPDAGQWSRKDTNGSSTAQPSSPNRDREIRRLACAKAAASFCSGKAIAGVDVSTEDLLKVAARIEKWVLEGGD